MQSLTTVDKRINFKCEGGPFDGKIIKLHTAHTLPISVGNFSGQYGKANESYCTSRNEFGIFYSNLLVWIPA